MTSCLGGRAILLGLALVFFAGCGDDGAGPSLDAGMDSRGTDVSRTDVPERDSGQPTTGLCGAIDGFIDNCVPEACDRALLTACEPAERLFNSSAGRSIEQCLDRGDALKDCTIASLASVTPGEAQRTFAAEFCARCVDSPSASCTEDFYRDESAPTAETAVLVLPFTDEFVDLLTLNCASGAGCGEGFSACFERELVVEGFSDLAADCLVRQLTSVEGSGGVCRGRDAGVPDGGSPDGGMDAGAADGGADGGMDMCSVMEPNEAREDARDLGSISDGASYPAGTVFAGLTNGDVDFFVFETRDEFGADVEPKAELMASGADLDLCIFWSCNGEEPGVGSAGCRQGEDAILDEFEGCCSRTGGDETVRLRPDCPGFDDTGEVFIRVDSSESIAACVAYELRWGDT